MNNDIKLPAIIYPSAQLKLLARLQISCLYNEQTNVM